MSVPPKVCKSLRQLRLLPLPSVAAAADDDDDEAVVDVERRQR